MQLAGTFTLQIQICNAFMTRSSQERIAPALIACAICLFALTKVQVAPAQNYLQERPRDLSGYWNFELDRSDSGVNQKWFSRQLRGYIKLPGILQAQYQGDEITRETPWVLSLYDRFWFLREEYKEYTERNV